MLVLGINAYHADSSACLLRDGKIISAVEEERFTRIKHYAGIPFKSIDYCLSNSDLSIEDIDAIAINTNPRAFLVQKIVRSLKSINNPLFIYNQFKLKQAKSLISVDLAEHYGVPLKQLPITRYVDHHLCHLASSYYSSSFSDATLVTVDGFGDYQSSSWGYGCSSTLRKMGSVLFPHSLGIFYQAMTQFLGFNNYGDEYKVMGMSPYGHPDLVYLVKQLFQRSDSAIFKLNLDYFSHHKQNNNLSSWSNGSPCFDPLYTPKLISLLGEPREPNQPLTQRHFNLAYATQHVYEEHFFSLLNHVYNLYPNESLCLSGGCAANSVANGKITKSTPFSQVFVNSSPGDAGGAIGAAYYTFQSLNPLWSHDGLEDTAYLGPSFALPDIHAAVESYATQLTDIGVTILPLSERSRYAEAAKYLSQGSVVGWFDGRSEFGPRSLGSRSILADPRGNDKQDLINQKIKLRESFRPFAPSVLDEHVDEWFSSKLSSPYMSFVLPIKEEKRSIIPAVCHVDGTGRLQTVTYSSSPSFYKLIEAFYRITGVPMLLNTSFNENEPIVNSPEEAISCFLRTQMDVLVLDHIFLVRSNAI